MAAAATFEFDHVAGQATAHVTGATVGHHYQFTCFDPDSASDFEIAASASFDMVVTGIGGFGAGEQTFMAYITDDTSTAIIATTVLDKDADGEFTFAAVWDYDGAGLASVSVTFFAELGVEYELDIYSDTDGESGTPFTGAGASHTLTTTKTGSPFAVGFIGELFQSTGDFNDFTTRLFAPGVAGEGLPGNPLLESPVVTEAPAGITGTTAVLQGAVNPEGISSTAFFEYGLTMAYGTTTPAQNLGSGTDPVDVEQFVAALRPGRTYHVRVVRNP